MLVEYQGARYNHINSCEVHRTDSGCPLHDSSEREKFEFEASDVCWFCRSNIDKCGLDVGRLVIS